MRFGLLTRLPCQTNFPFFLPFYSAKCYIVDNIRPNLIKEKRTMQGPCYWPLIFFSFFSLLLGIRPSDASKVLCLLTLYILYFMCSFGIEHVVQCLSIG